MLNYCKIFYTIGQNIFQSRAIDKKLRLLLAPKLRRQPLSFLVQSKGLVILNTFIKQVFKIFLSCFQISRKQHFLELTLYLLIVAILQNVNGCLLLKTLFFNIFFFNIALKKNNPFSFCGLNNESTGFRAHKNPF